jgi:hypothetical protein
MSIDDNKQGSKVQFPLDKIESRELCALLTVPNTQCYLIEGTSKKIIGTGELQVLELGQDALLFHIQDVFNYVMTKHFPSMKASRRTYVFPTAYHTCWGLLFPETMSDRDLELFEDLLGQYSQFTLQMVPRTQFEKHEEEKKVMEAAPQKVDDVREREHVIAVYVKKGADFTRKGIKKGTAILMNGIDKTVQEVKVRIQVREEKPVSESTKKRLLQARVASDKAVKISAAVLDTANKACNELATAIVQGAFKKADSKPTSASMKNAKDIGRASVVSALMILEELQEAGMILVAGLADASAEVTEHRYGDEMGAQAKQVAKIVKDSALVVKNVSSMGWKKVLKRLAGNVAVNVLSSDEQENAKRIETELENCNENDPELRVAEEITRTAREEEEEHRNVRL